MSLFSSPLLDCTGLPFGLDPGTAKPVQTPLDSFYSQVPGGKCHEWYEGEGEIWEMSECYVDFKLF